ncbi:MAG: hypothetical protein GEU76_01155 [Alphaproteobacteria bacterium]|nr:hypothetical protein [Alphaproteobacteria bacterium]
MTKADRRAEAARPSPRRGVPRYVPKQRAKPAQKPLSGFVIFPRAVLRNPPLRHRDDAPEVGLTVFELAVAGALIMTARQATAEDLHAVAWSAGRDAIKTARAALTPEQMYRVTNNGFEVGSDLISGAGSAAYHDRRRAGRPGAKIDPGADIEVEISRREILRRAGLVYSARSAAMLVPALQRLTRDIGKRSPILTTLRLENRAVFLTVGDAWLPRGQFGKVPWPLPTRRGGATVAALWLVLHGADVRRGGPAMRMDALVERLGLSARGAADVNHKIDAALDCVNRHARALGLAVIFRIAPAPGDDTRIRIIAAAARTAAPVEKAHPGASDGLTADEIEERHEAVQRERETQRAFEHDGARRRAAGLLARLRA